MQLLFTQAGCPLGSLVAQTCPPSGVAQPPQLVAVLVVSTQDPLQSVCALVGQPVPQVGVSDTARQTGVPPSHETPQAPQLEPEVSETQAPLHMLKPLAQAKPQVPAVHVGIVLGTEVVQTLTPASVPQPPQLSGSLVVSTQLPAHTVALELGQLDMHANPFPEGAQRGVAPLHVEPQPPQLDGVFWSTQALLQRISPGGQPPESSVAAGPSSPAYPSLAPSPAPSGRRPPSTEAVASPHLPEQLSV